MVNPKSLKNLRPPSHSKEKLIELGKRVGLSNKGRKLSKRQKENIGTANRGNPKRMGENHWHWKGGVTPFRKKMQGTLEYKLWRQSVFERDNYTCIWCGANNKDGNRTTLNADHIKPWALFPEFRLAIDNGRTLCVPCHKTTDTYGGHIR